MPLVESEAIILRTRVFGDADKLVTFLSRARGRLHGVAPNARRSRRRFGAALEPLSYVRLWFFEREHQELVRLSEAELIAPLWDTRQDYQRSVALTHIAELADTLLPEREPSERFFRLLLMTLRQLRHWDSFWLPLTYFQLWSVRLAGWLPDLEHCSRCHKELRSKPAYFRPVGGGLLCRHCRPRGTCLLGPGSRRDAQTMLSNPLHKISPQGWARERAAELQAYLLTVIESHAERKLMTRELLHE